MNKIRVFEAFSGIGAQAMALKRLQAQYPDMLDFEFVGTSEIEPSAIKSYNAVHGDVKCYGDITKIDWSQVPDFDLFTMSSPCQDFSVAGRQAGAEEGSGTRSSLLWECRKAIIAKKPRYILFENVSAVVSKKFIRGFNKWQAELESYGYTNFAKVLNSKDYGVPQNRERIFMLSIWGGASYHFPEPFKLEKRIKDILEPYGTVDESFYFSPEQLLRIIAHCDRKVSEGCGFKTQFHTEDEISGCDTTRYGQRETDPCIKEGISIHPLNRKMEFQGFKSIKSDTAPCLTAHDSKGEPVLWQRLSMYENNNQRGRIYDIDGICPTLVTPTGGNSEPKILEPCILAYTRDDNGKVCDRHNKEIANTIHGSTGNGGNTDQFVKEPVDRQSKIRSKVMPNSNIRFYQDDESKSGISEMQIIHPDNECPTITVAHVPKILEPMVGNDPRRIFGQDDFKTDVCPALMAVDYKAPKLVKEPIELSLANLPDKTVLQDDDGRGYLLQDGSLWRVRKLVPIEVFRLQDVSDEDAKKIIAVCSKTVCYQLAGNSITVAVLYHIFRKLWIDIECESAQKSLFDL